MTIERRSCIATLRRLASQVCGSVGSEQASDGVLIAAQCGLLPRSTRREMKGIDCGLAMTISQRRCDVLHGLT
jgi:hypothetical protein